MRIEVFVDGWEFDCCSHLVPEVGRLSSWALTLTPSDDGSIPGLPQERTWRIRDDTDRPVLVENGPVTAWWDVEPPLSTPVVIVSGRLCGTAHWYLTPDGHEVTGVVTRIRTADRDAPTDPWGLVDVPCGATDEDLDHPWLLLDLDVPEGWTP